MPYNKAEKDSIRDRIRYWLEKDPSLTTRQICTLTGSNPRTVSKIRKDMNIPPLGFETPTQKDINNAYYKFMEKRNVPTHCVNPEFNPWFQKRESADAKKIEDIK
jgi:hypothetical protein